MFAKETVARLSDRITVEHWNGQTYWTWVVADEYANGIRQIRAYATKSGALRAGRNLARKEQANGRPICRLWKN